MISLLIFLFSSLLALLVNCSSMGDNFFFFGILLEYTVCFRLNPELACGFYYLNPPETFISILIFCVRNLNTLVWFWFISFSSMVRSHVFYLKRFFFRHWVCFILTSLFSAFWLFLLVLSARMASCHLTPLNEQPNVSNIKFPRLQGITHKFGRRFAPDMSVKVVKNKRN